MHTPWQKQPSHFHNCVFRESSVHLTSQSFRPDHLLLQMIIAIHQDICPFSSLRALLKYRTLRCRVFSEFLKSIILIIQYADICFCLIFSNTLFRFDICLHCMMTIQMIGSNIQNRAYFRMKCMYCLQAGNCLFPLQLPRRPSFLVQRLYTEFLYFLPHISMFLYSPA